MGMYFESEYKQHEHWLGLSVLEDAGLSSELNKQCESIKNLFHTNNFYSFFLL